MDVFRNFTGGIHFVLLSLYGYNASAGKTFVRK